MLLILDNFFSSENDQLVVYGTFDIKLLFEFNECRIVVCQLDTRSQHCIGKLEMG